MIKKIIISTILLFATITNSQEIKSYTWENNPKFKEIPKEYENQPAVVLLDKRWIHTRVGDYAFATFIMNHVAIKINKAEEINKYNKIKAEDDNYIRTVRDFHARIIKPNGEIKVLPQEKIVETEVEKVKSIVFEGVEAGDILEYYFILKENPSSYGVEIFQKDIPVLTAEFTITNSGVNFQTFPSIEFSKNNDGSKVLFTASNIPPYIDEKNSKNTKNLVKLIYLVSTPSMSSKNWSFFLPQNFKKPSFEYFKKNQAKDFIEKLNVKDKTTEEKLLKLDEYIKENFDFVWRGEKAQKIKDLNEGKIKLKASDIFDLYGFTLKELNIPYKIVVGVDRFYADIDETTYVNPFPHEFMYYIPETQKFLSPYEKYLSYGYPMYELQGSNAITFDPKEKVIGKMIFPIAPSNYTRYETTSTVTLKDDLSNVSILKTYSTSGYTGQIERNTYKYLKGNEEEKELINFIKKRILNDVDVKIIEHTAENLEFKNNHSNTFFTINAKLESNESFTENAGNLLLVNIGKAIGKQKNLYQVTERKTDIDLLYNKEFKHKIIFNIPQGYEVESYKDLIIDKKMNFNEDYNCSFKSEVKVEGNQVIVEVNETYKSINYSKELYQEYRKVVNASADFNKATLVLRPKKQ